MFDAEVLKMQKIVEKPEDTKEVNLWLPKKNTSAKSKNSVKSNHVLPLEIEPVLLFYDLETGGFHNDILQISITRGHENSEEDLNVYILPTGSIDARASNVNGMSVSYVSGKKQLVNRNKEVLPTISQVDAAEKVLTYLIGLLRATEAPLLLIAHSGNSFDQPKLIAFLQKQGNYMDMHALESKTFLETAIKHPEEF